jgi:hypothetical protein
LPMLFIGKDLILLMLVLLTPKLFDAVAEVVGEVVVVDVERLVVLFGDNDPTPAVKFVLVWVVVVLVDAALGGWEELLVIGKRLRPDNK